MERQLALGQHGSVTLREDGPRAEFAAEMPDDGKGLYKVLLLGAQGRLLLGTLMPEQGTLRLKRTLTLDALKRQGVWPVLETQADLAFSFQKEQSVPAGWAREGHPAQLLGDALLSRAAEGLSGALSKRRPDGFELALPYEEKGAFGLTPLFCFAQIETLGQRPYAVFAFNSRGCPVFTPKKA